MSIKIKNLPETERPYEKLELYGAKNLSNAELLAIIIKTGTKEKTAIEIADEILNLNKNIDKNNLNYLRDVTIEEFMKVKGIGKVKAIQLKAICELSVRMNKPVNYKQVIIKTPNDVANILMNDLRFEKREIAKVLILNAKNALLKIVDVALGGNTFTNIPVNIVLSEAVKIVAPKIILVHNHPSGDPTPSKADLKFTEELEKAAKIFDIELIDHIVIGDMKYHSIYSEKLKMMD